jgi:hypothetical protein
MKINKIIKILIFVMVFAIIALVFVRLYGWDENKIEITSYGVSETGEEEIVEEIEVGEAEEVVGDVEVILNKNLYKMGEDVAFTFKINGNDVYIGGEDVGKTWLIFRKDRGVWRDVKIKVEDCEQLSCIDNKLVTFCINKIECGKKEEDIKGVWDQSYWWAYDGECGKEVYIGYKKGFVEPGVYKIRFMYADGEDCEYDNSAEKEFEIR